MMQTIPHGTWTTVRGRELQVFQDSGATSWVDIRDDGQITFGPADSWSARQNSGASLDLSDMTPGVALTIDWH